MAERVFPVKIGLEVHGYLDTREKLFCMCRVREDESGVGNVGESGVNDRICPICTGTPGSKPMGVNSEAVRKMVEIALVFGSRINYDVVWQRKHYSWADLPKGYQITISGAHAKVNAEGGKFRGIKIREIHLEEDPAQWNPDSGKINYNRSGLPLIEIVTEPEFGSAEEVVDWLKNLVLSLSYVKALRKNAGIKVDVNVSTYGERVEMKNLNSLDKIRRAIEYEVVRQSENFAKGIEQERETLAFDEKLGRTVKMRSKEGAADYRFIPDPDLPVLKIDKKLVADVKVGMPEMPEVKLDRLLKKYKVSDSDAKILTKNLELVEFFEELVEPKDVVGNVVIIHGCPSGNEPRSDKQRSKEMHWRVWVKRELEKVGVGVKIPLMPEPWAPDYEKFKNELDKLDIDENSVLVGHSCGGAFLVRWLGDTKKKVKKLILVAPWKIAHRKDGSDVDFYGYKIDKCVKKNVGEIVIFTSNNEEEDGKKSVKIFEKEIGGRVVELRDCGHFVFKHMKTYEFPKLLDEILSSSKGVVDVKKNMSWVTVELLRVLNYNKKSLEDVDVDIRPEHLAELIAAVDSGRITRLKGKQIMNDFVPRSFSIKDGRDIGMISDEAVKNLCRQVIDENAHVVDEYKSGKAASLNYLIGQVMRLSERRADFKRVTEILRGMLG